MLKNLKDTGRTALTVNGVERVFETFNDTGVFAGATYEVLESEIKYMSDDQDRELYGPVENCS